MADPGDVVQLPRWTSRFTLSAQKPGGGAGGGGVLPAAAGAARREDQGASSAAFGYAGPALGGGGGGGGGSARKGNQPPVRNARGGRARCATRPGVLRAGGPRHSTYVVLLSTMQKYPTHFSNKPFPKPHTATAIAQAARDAGPRLGAARPRDGPHTRSRRPRKRRQGAHR